MTGRVVRIKICGLSRSEDCLAVNAAKADYAGFVFAPSRRRVEPATAAGLIRLLEPGIQAVGVFVDESNAQIMAIARLTGISVVQIHGPAIPDRIARLRSQLPPGTAIWQRLPVPLDQPAETALAEAERTIRRFRADADQNAKLSRSLPDAWLLDSCRAGQTGGTGQIFAWPVFREFCRHYPVILAGGLDAGNVGAALQQLDLLAIDCSSGVETGGQKDPARIMAFCQAARAGQSADPGAIQDGSPDSNPAIRLSDHPTEDSAMTDSKPINPGDLPDERGRFGAYGGQYAAETLMPALTELIQAYGEARSDPEFMDEYRRLLRDYAGRPSLLYKAERVSAELGLPVYLKREDLNHTGAHKINNVLGQVLLARRMGKTHLIAETGAGQHGVATATVAALFGLSCDVFMGAEDTERQALNVYRMELLGTRVHAVRSGTATLKDATSEAMREWSRRADDTFYVIGSTMGPHPYPMIVRDFQRVIGDEIRSQMLEKTGRLPAALIACVGGGSNAMGTFYPFLRDQDIRLYGAEAAGEGLETGRHAATMTGGSLGVFHGMHSLFLQDDDGQIKPVYSISAGLDYPGIGPEHVYLQEIKRARYFAVTDREAVDAFTWLARLEGIIPAIESAHALALLRRLAADGEWAANEPVVVTLSGRGDKDVASIQAWQRARQSVPASQTTRKEAEPHA